MGIAGGLKATKHLIISISSKKRIDTLSKWLEKSFSPFILVSIESSEEKIYKDISNIPEEWIKQKIIKIVYITKAKIEYCGIIYQDDFDIINL